MNPWRILNIDPTDDKKAIKKAYAVLLKKYKPDEYPERFKEIQLAYKTALEQFNRKEIKPAEKPPVENTNVNNPENVEDNNEELILQETQPEVNVISEQDIQNQEIIAEQLFQQIHAMAFAPLVIKSKIENWKFLEQFYDIDDLLFRNEVARAIFQKTAEYNLFQMKQNRTLLIPSIILKYFNEIFDWTSKWQEYQRLYEDRYFIVTYYYIENDRKFSGIVDSIANPVKRIWSFTLDFFITGIVIFPFLIFIKDERVLSFIFISLFMLLRLWFELRNDSSASLGKKLNDLETFDLFGNYCSYKHILLRHLFLNLQLTVFLFIDEKTMKVNPFFFIIGGLIIILNTITYLSRKGLVHDYLSKTIIISK
ncbi:MAG: RDD family protein [Xanthomonadales bacterium]|nr:RDD family protein [Xanthomonadales bacterium]